MPIQTSTVKTLKPRQKTRKRNPETSNETLEEKVQKLEEQVKDYRAQIQEMKTLEERLGVLELIIQKICNLINFLFGTKLGFGSRVATIPEKEKQLLEAKITDTDKENAKVKAMALDKAYAEFQKDNPDVSKNEWLEHQAWLQTQAVERDKAYEDMQAAEREKNLKEEFDLDDEIEAEAFNIDNYIFRLRELTSEIDEELAYIEVHPMRDKYIEKNKEIANKANNTPEPVLAEAQAADAAEAAREEKIKEALETNKEEIMSRYEMFSKDKEELQELWGHEITEEYLDHLDKSDYKLGLVSEEEVRERYLKNKTQDEKTESEKLEDGSYQDEQWWEDHLNARMMPEEEAEKFLKIRREALEIDPNDNTTGYEREESEEVSEEAAKWAKNLLSERVEDNDLEQALSSESDYTDDDQTFEAEEDADEALTQR